MRNMFPNISLRFFEQVGRFPPVKRYFFIHLTCSQSFEPCAFLRHCHPLIMTRINPRLFFQEISNEGRGKQNRTPHCLLELSPPPKLWFSTLRCSVGLSLVYPPQREMAFNSKKENERETSSPYNL